MRRIWLALSFVIACFLGVAGFIAPVPILHPRHYSAPLFPLLRTAVEGMSFLTILFLFCAGFLVGCFGRGHPLLLGLATVSLLPMFAIAEMIVSPTSHNLWPLEFAIYGFVSLSAIAGAFLGRFTQRRLSHAKV
jgi:hypothetical protein